MSTQLSLLDQVARAQRDAAGAGRRPVALVISSRDAVIACGANAPEVPEHRVLPQVPDVSDETARAMLRLAETTVRYDAAPRARIDDWLAALHTPRSGSGSGSVTSDHAGVWHLRTGERIAWSVLLAALRHAREMEPEVARLRDLAQARRYLHYYARAYGPSGPPPALLERIREEIAALGGDPTESVEASR